MEIHFYTISFNWIMLLLTDYKKRQIDAEKTPLLESTQISL